MKKTLILSVLLLTLLSACAAPAEIPPITTPTHPNPSPTASPEDTQTPATVTPPPTQALPNLREIPSLYPPMQPLPFAECPFAASAEIEQVIGSLIKAPVTRITFQPPYYDARASLRCEAVSGQTTLYIEVWFAPDIESARADYNEVKALIGADGIPVRGVGDESLWWQAGLRLETLSEDVRITVSLADSLPDAAHQTALLAALTIESVHPSAVESAIETIQLPVGVTEPETVHVRDLVNEGEFFQACSLLTEEEYEAALGALEFPLQSGGNIGELEPFEIYDCLTDPNEAIGWMYFGLVFGTTPGDMILNYRRGGRNYPPNATPMENLGDEAWYWETGNGSNLNLSVLRGNVNLVLNVLMEDGYENRGKLRALARLILDRLFEHG